MRSLLLVSFVLTAAAQPGPILIDPGQQPTGSGVIEGIVVNQLTHQPIKKAQVTLQGTAYLAAVTDTTGHFAFKDLPAGNYMLLANAAKFPGGRSQALQQIKLEADGKVSDVTLSLLPPATLSGRIVDEDGSPMSNCNVSILQANYQIDDGSLLQKESSQTMDTGEYRFPEVEPGRYKIGAVCYRNKILPHAFMEHSPDVDVPALTYPPQFYPGTSDLAGSSTVVVAPGADVSGIDFRMTPATGIAIHGRVSGAPDGEFPMIILESRDPQRRTLFGLSGRVRKAGKFSLANVLPGAYDLTVFTLGEGPLLFASVPLDVGSQPMEALDIALAPGLTFTGTVSMDDNSKLPENMQVMLQYGRQRMMRRQPHAEVRKDGTFVLTEVVPGNWSVYVNNTAGYSKSLSLNDQELPGISLEVPQGGMGGKLKIVLGTKWSSVEFNVTGESEDPPGGGGIMWPDAAHRRDGFRSNFSLDNHNHAELNRVPPGHYHACFVPPVNEGSVLDNFLLLKKLESRCEAFDVPESSKTSIEIPRISAAELQALSNEP